MEFYEKPLSIDKQHEYQVEREQIKKKMEKFRHKCGKEIDEVLSWENKCSEELRHRMDSAIQLLSDIEIDKMADNLIFCVQHKSDIFFLLEIVDRYPESEVKAKPDLSLSVKLDYMLVHSGVAEFFSSAFRSLPVLKVEEDAFKTTVAAAIRFKQEYSNYQSNKEKFARIKEKYERWKNDNKNMARYISSISGENLLKPPKEYELLLKKVELQLEKVPKILEQQKQLEFDSDLYKLADEILSGGIRDADYETYKNKVEEFEQKFEEFNKNQDLKNDDNKLDDEKELHEDEIGNDNDGGTLENEDVSEEKSDDSNSECSNGGACNCLKNILWYRVFLCLSLLSLLLLIISVYCLIVTIIFLLASVVLYFIQKTKKDNDNMEVMADNLLSSEINQEQSKDLISVDINRDDNVKQKNEFSLFGRANDGIN